MAATSASAAPKRQRAPADGDAAQAIIELIHTAAQKAEDLAKKCRNVNFTEAGLQELERRLLAKEKVSLQHTHACRDGSMLRLHAYSYVLGLCACV